MAIEKKLQEFTTSLEKQVEWKKKLKNAVRDFVNMKTKLKFYNMWKIILKKLNKQKSSKGEMYFGKKQQFGEFSTKNYSYANS